MTIMTIVTNPWFLMGCAALFAVLCAFIESKRKPVAERLAPNNTPVVAKQEVEKVVKEMQKASIENPQVADSKPKHRKNRRRKSHNPNG